jgi:hypothetical protein
MAIFSTRVHGILDYLLGALLIASPWVLGFATGGPAQWVPLGVGTAVVLYSLFTDYELGVVRKIQVPAHLLLDALGGVLLIVSPWLFGFDEWVWMPHVVFGAIELLAAMLTHTIPSYERRGLARAPTA